MFLNAILSRPGAPCIGLSQGPSSRNAYDGLGGLSKPFVRTGWRALLAADLLQKTLLIYRPY